MTEDLAQVMDAESVVRTTQKLLEGFKRESGLPAPEFSESLSSYLSNEGFSESADGKAEDSRQSPKTEGFDQVPEKKKRGRKPLRPLDPVRKKTEEKDKYWLRAFRAYMRMYYPTVREHMRSDDQEFWDWYLSAEGKPGKGNQFASYGKLYKQSIFSHSTFTLFFRQWFREFGDLELSKKCPRHSDLWIVFHEYATRDLCFYNELQRQERMQTESPLLVAETVAPAIDDITLDMDLNPDALLCSPLDRDF